MPVSAPRPIQAAWRCGILENEEYPLEVDGNQIAITLRPYEIATVMLRMD